MCLHQTSLLVHTEQWREIGNGYLVSSHGRVARFGKLCDGWVSERGYRYIEIAGKKFRLHRLVYETFNGLIPDGMVIDHVNSVKTDNRLSNLEAVTQRENVNRAMASGRYTGSPKKRSGFRHTTPEEREQIRAMKRRGLSKAEIVRITGRAKSLVEKVLKEASPCEGSR